MEKQEEKNNLKSLIFQFDKYLEIVKGRSESTRKIYINRLKKFFEWFDKNKYQKIDKNIIWQFRIYLSEQKLNKRTQAHYLIVIRNFLKFLKRELNLDVMDFTQIELPKLPEREIKILNESELEKLLNAPKGNDLKSLRDKAILELLFSTGLRVSELRSLNRDIEIDKGEIAIKGKGDKIRTVFLSERAKKALKEYLQNRTDDHPALFISLARNMEPKRLSVRAIQKIIKFYAIKVGIIKNVHPHVLRHQLATFLISAGVNLRVVQEILGHKNISTTQVYTHISRPELKEIYEKIINKKLK